MKLWTPSLSRLFAGALLLCGLPALAQLGSSNDSAACCQLTTTLANDIIKPQDMPGDERFFMTEGAPPNIHFLFDTSCSMRELVHTKGSDHDAFFDQGEGCTGWATTLAATQAARGWDPNKVYPVPDTGTGEGSDTGHFSLFQDNKYYSYISWADSTSPTPTWNTKEAACRQQHWGDGDGSTADGDQDDKYLECLQCLQTKGYYKKPGITYEVGDAYDSGSNPYDDSRFIFWGRYLNFDPPRYVTAKKVLKGVIKNLRRVRAGISEFDGDGGAMVKGQNPSCDQIIKNAASWDSNRASYIKAVDDLRFDEGTPLARALLNVGQYFSSTDDIYRNKFGFSDYGYPSDFKNDSLNSQGRSWCWGCQISSVIIITDGEPSGDSLPATTLSKIQSRNGGAVTCPADFPCPDTGNYKLDDVAKFLANQDLQQTDPPRVNDDFNTAGKQSMSIYTIGFGLDSNLLRNTAKVGNGLYYTASDADALEKAILEIIQNVQTRATSFSSTSVASLQVNRAGGTLVPRFKPSKSGNNAPWQGFLYRFSLAPEVLLGCVKDASGTNAKDLNKDGDCDDIHLIDKNDKAVIEDDEGNFLLLDDPIVSAEPFWEAGKNLKADAASKTEMWKARKIYTIIDNSGPAGTKDGKIDRYDTPIEFKEENADKLQEYLGISDNPLECDALKTQLGLASLSPLECTALVIRYYRGANVLSPDMGLRPYDRPFLLHDLFHSSPVTVEPPTPKFFCGYSNQCLDTLYAGKTEKQTYTGADGKQRDAYEEYLDRNGDRMKVVLVGSNGGMLHAFQNGTVAKKDEVTGLYEYNAGTGEELWAFIPPDLLPRLRPNMGKHAYLVDGTAMVRETWLDGVGSGASADGKKQHSEYRTVAVVGTGTGGVHRFAMDLTDMLPSSKNGVGSPRPPNKAGDFLWMWPQPCDELATQLGEAFTNYTPKPPPIGPVAMYDEDGPWKLGTGTKNAREQWVVFFNGGHDPYLTRGRGVAMVDIKTGETLWSMFNGDDTGKRPHADKMRYPFSAGVTMMDLGNATSSVGDADLLFDTAVIPDFGGQLWVVRFWEPGVRESGSSGPVNNWFAARSFQVATNATQKTDEKALRPAFSYMAANTIQPDTGYLRTYLGTGDRYHLTDVSTTCSLGNPRGCAQLGCKLESKLHIDRGAVRITDLHAKLGDYKYEDAKLEMKSGGESCKEVKVSYEWNYDKQDDCTNDDGGKVEYSCTGSELTWSCSLTNEWSKVNNPGPVPATSPNRYYGVWSYGVVNDEGKGLARMFNTKGEAEKFDQLRFYDDGLIDVGQFNTTTGTVDIATEKQAGSLDKGWFINYKPGPERTGTGSTIIDGCVIWSSFEPSGEASAVCSTTGTNIARTYQANFVSGKADCAASFLDADTSAWTRYLKSSTVAAPPEPAPQRTMVNGKVYSSAVIPGVGGGGGGGTQQFIVGENKEVLQSIYQLEVDQATHDCRHANPPTNCK